MALQFVQRWDTTARYFLSAMFADPSAGLAAGTKAGLTETDFPRVELWTIGRYLCAAADSGIQPTIRALILATEANGDVIGNGNPADLEWLDSLCYGSAAHVEYYARLLVDFALRRRLADLLQHHHSEVLAVGADVGGCLSAVEAELRELRGGTADSMTTPETPGGAVFIAPTIRKRRTG